jgi:hypothetical protein
LADDGNVDDDDGGDGDEERACWRPSFWRGTFSLL